MGVLVFDIETGPAPMPELQKIVDPYVRKNEDELVALSKAIFDPESVKYGRMTDPAKRAAKLEESRMAFERSQREAVEELTLNRGEGEYWDAVQKDAGLDATIGRVVAIGYKTSAKRWIEGIGIDIGITRPAEEDDLLMSFWTTYRFCIDKRATIVGHNICGFDLPFLIQRSWIRGVCVPESVIKDDRYWNPIFADTMKRWGCGQWGRDGSRKGLDRVSRAMGMHGKTGDGADFWKLWESDRPKAVAYLQADLELTWAVGVKLGIITAS